MIWLFDACNIYRYMADEYGLYVEVLLYENEKTHRMKCELDHLWMFKLTRWEIVSYKNIRPINGYGFFHTFAYPEFECIGYKNSDKLDNRRRNIIDFTRPKRRTKRKIELISSSDSDTSTESLIPLEVRPFAEGDEGIPSRFYLI